MDKEEIVAWLRNPCTQWFQREMSLLFPEANWRGAVDWDSINLKKGQQQVMDFVKRPQDLVE